MKNFTYKLFGSLFLLSTAFVGNSQIDVYYENFEGATSGFTLNTSDVNSLPTVENKWIINNNYVGGTFFNATCGALGTIINTPDQVPAITGAPQSKYMHIYSNSAAQPSIFGAAIFNCNFVVTDNPASTCVIHGNSFAKQTSPISTVGISNVTLSFYWICSAGNPVFGELYFSTNGGTVWTQLTAPISNYSGSSVWTQQIITNPQFDNQANLQFGFRFLASATTAALNDPAF